MMSVIRLLARSAFAAIFLSGGYSALTEPGPRPDRVRDTLHLPEPELMVRANGGAMLGLGAALAVGLKPRLAAAALAAILLPTTYVGHRFWAEESEQGRRMQRVHFFKNLSLMGGLVVYAVGDGD